MYSLVIPVYRNEETIAPLLAAFVELNERLTERLEVVFVVDGSTDKSYALLRQQLGDMPFDSELVLLSRNFGAFSAIRAGLSIAEGPYFAVMAADLQEPPELVEQFFTVLQKQEIDVVLGQRAERRDPLATRWTSAIFWWWYRLLIQREMPRGGVDVFGCNRAVRDALVALDEAHSSLVGQLIWLGFRRQTIPYNRAERVAGKSSWTLRKRFRYMLDSVFAFTDLPIVLLGITGVVGVTTSLFLSLIVFTAWLTDSINVPGYTPLMLGLLFATSVNLLGLGIVGAYVWRIFENSKGRPLAINLSQESFPRNVDENREEDGRI